MALTRASAAVIKTEEIVNNRNRIINGAMEIDQRNAGSSVNISAGTTTYTLDRWALFLGNTSAVATVQQDSSAPAGFIKSLKISVNTADSSVASDDRARITHRIEGLNFADFAYGTANAKPCTISFWVKSNLTGTFSVVIYNSANNRSLLKNYTILSADTWEYKTLTFTGDTTGTWLTDTGVGLNIAFNFMAGTGHQNTENVWQAVPGPYGTSSQTNLFSSTSNYINITGVQLEVGSVATPFERRPYGTELSLCQRYYAKTYDINEVPGTNTSASYWVGASHAQTTNVSWGASYRYPVEMRAAPTATAYTVAGTAGSLGYSYRGSSATGAVTVFGKGSKAVSFYHNETATGMTQGDGIAMYGHIVVSAEL